MNTPSLFDPGPSAPPRNDAAPLAGGACVKGRNTSPNSTSARLPLSPPTLRQAPSTSSAAACRIAGHAKDLRARVQTLAGHGPHGTVDALSQAALGVKPQTCTARRGQLAEMGMVADFGERGRTASGRPAAVWVMATCSSGLEGGAV